MTQTFREWIDSWPLDKAWVEEQIKRGTCPHCGEKYERWEGKGAQNWRCFPVISSVWCGTIRRHIVRPERET